MSSPQGSPEGAGHLHQEPDRNQVSKPQISELERVLEETLARHATDRGLTVDERESLLRVARQHQDASVELETVVPKLVASLLHVHLQSLQLPPETWLDMCSRIAESLLDAPQARSRLEQLWAQLCESV